MNFQALVLLGIPEQNGLKKKLRVTSCKFRVKTRNLYPATRNKSS